jgi:hypothetical protein
VPKITWPGIASLEIESNVDWWGVEPLNAPPDAIRIGRLIGNTHNLEVTFSFSQDFNK